MGISSLLPVLKDMMIPGHISNYRSQRIAVDGFSWLHRSTYACSVELCTNVKTEKYVRYCLQLTHMMLYHGVKIIVVFDGRALNAKGMENEKRRQDRAEYVKLGWGYYNAGQMDKAKECFKRGCSVTREMVLEFVLGLRTLKAQGHSVDYIVAPYEADAQMAYFVFRNICAAALTEDSDLIAYGTETVLLKMDAHGNLVTFRRRNLFMTSNLKYSFRQFNDEMFLELCILLGCDYLPSIAQVGIAKVHDLMSRYRSGADVIKWMETNVSGVPLHYAREFQKAKLIFKHHRVYDVLTCKLVHLRPLPAGFSPASLGLFDDNDLDLVGPLVDPTLAFNVSRATVHPTTHELFPGETLLPLPSSHPHPPAPAAAAADDDYNNNNTDDGTGGGGVGGGDATATEEDKAKIYFSSSMTAMPCLPIQKIQKLMPAFSLHFRDQTMANTAQQNTVDTYFVADNSDNKNSHDKNNNNSGNNSNNHTTINDSKRFVSPVSEALSIPTPSRQQSPFFASAKAAAAGSTTNDDVEELRDAGNNNNNSSSSSKIRMLAPKFSYKRSAPDSTHNNNASGNHGDGGENSHGKPAMQLSMPGGLRKISFSPLVQTPLNISAHSSVTNTNSNNNNNISNNNNNSSSRSLASLNRFQFHGSNNPATATAADAAASPVLIKRNKTSNNHSNNSNSNSKVLVPDEDDVVDNWDDVDCEYEKDVRATQWNEQQKDDVVEDIQP